MPKNIRKLTAIDLRYRAQSSFKNLMATPATAAVFGTKTSTRISTQIPFQATLLCFSHCWDRPMFVNKPAEIFFGSFSDDFRRPQLMMEPNFAFLQVAMLPKLNSDARSSKPLGFLHCTHFFCKPMVRLRWVSLLFYWSWAFNSSIMPRHFEPLSISSNANSQHNSTLLVRLAMSIFDTF